MPVRWHSELVRGADFVRYGCFDWDPFGAFLPGNIGMIEQEVTTMLAKVFDGSVPGGGVGGRARTLRRSAARGRG